MHGTIAHKSAKTVENPYNWGFIQCGAHDRMYP